MNAEQKVLFVDAATGFYRLARYPVGDFFGPVDLGLHLAGKYNSLNIGVGPAGRLDLPGLQPADPDAASRRAGAASTSPRWAGPGWSSTTWASTWCRWSARRRGRRCCT